MFDGRRKFDICVAPSRKRSGMGISIKDNGCFAKICEAAMSAITGNIMAGLFT